MKKKWKGETSKEKEEKRVGIKGRKRE